jgi:hypothetical protein
MYSLGIFLFIAFIDVALTLYAILKKGADYYKDLIALAAATFITVYLAIAAVSGTVILSSSHVQTIATVGDTSTVVYAPATVIQDDGLMWIGIIIAVIQGIFLLLEIVETVEDYYAQKAESLIS